MRYDSSKEVFKALVEGKKLTCLDLNYEDYICLDEDGDIVNQDGEYAMLDGDNIYEDYIPPRVLPAFADNIMTLDMDKFTCGLTDCDECPFRDGGDCRKVELGQVVLKLRSMAEKWLEEGRN